MSFMSDYKKELKKITSGSSGGTTSTAKSSKSTGVTGKTSDFMSKYREELSKIEEQESILDRLAQPASAADRVRDRMTVEQEDDRKWYQRGHFEDGWDFGDITKTILGIEPENKSSDPISVVSDDGILRNSDGREFVDPSPDMTLEEVRGMIDNAGSQEERNHWSQVYNEKYFTQNARVLYETQMEGMNHSVLEEMHIIAQMEDGEERDRRKDAVLAQMEEMGIDTEDYAIYSGDKNFTWGTFFKWLGQGAEAGLNMASSSFTKTADVLLGGLLKGFGWENNPISAWNEYHTALYEGSRYDVDLYRQKLGGGGGMEFAGEAVEGTIGAIPAALAAIMSGGTSLTGTAASSASLTTNALRETGNILTKAGLTAETMMRNPQYWISFAQTLGRDYEEAKANGASDVKAAFGSILSSLINAGIEIGVDGGSGIQGLPSDIAEGGSKFWSWIESSFEEGGEELLQKFVTEGINKVVYGSDAEMLNPIEYAREGLIGTISGVALGGGQIALQSTINAINSTEGRLTANERKVVDKVYKDLIAEREQNGKLTLSEKNKLRDRVIEDMKKGYISTDTIEEVLGGDTFKQYQDAVNKENTLQQDYDTLKKEYDGLYDMSIGNKSSRQVDRENYLKGVLPEVQKALDDARATSGREQLRTQLNQEVSRLVQGDRLIESYNENARAYQDFQADFEKFKGAKYEDAAKRTLENAVKAGANNTNKIREVVEFAAERSGETGLTFTFASHEEITDAFIERQTAEIEKLENLPEAQKMAELKKKLLDMKKLLEEAKNGDVIVDGDIVDGDIVLNMGSPDPKKNRGRKPVYMVVGHEITHSLEPSNPNSKQADRYRNLRDSLFSYAQSQGRDVAKMLHDKELQYSGVSDANPEAELVADLVGEYLFMDSDYVKRLSVENQNVFQWLWNEIKHLCKMATAGSDAARELERARKLFEDAYREGGKKQTATKHSLTPVDAVLPTSDKWSRTHTTEEAMAVFPDMWNVAAEESEVRNPTQIVSTVNSYRKIYNFLKNEGFNGTILDASSGLGYGTRAGIEEFGFDVEDIEPYPDKGYTPKYQDYSALDNKYDVIISNAVLNVLPQDQRDALAIKMGELLNDGGRLFVNVRGKDVESLAKTGKNIHLGNMEWIETVKGSYQQGFTKPELVAYLQDALGNGFTVKPTTMFGAVSAVVTKNGARYSLSKSQGEYAPTFYSQMAKVVDGVKQEKLGASSVVNMLRGKGVKAEEIKWSGIEEWLEGKRSVTKTELQEFVNNSMLQIEEETRGGESFNEFLGEWRRIMDYDTSAEDIVVDENFLSETEAFLQDAVDEGDLEQEEKDHLMDLARKAAEGSKPSKWDDYKLDGGSNYREIVFKMPGSDYSNEAMRAHWGADTGGVFAHARVQDFDTDSGKMLFIEEIQSDWHNEGRLTGYATDNRNARDAAYKRAEQLRAGLLKDLTELYTAMGVDYPADAAESILYRKDLAEMAIKLDPIDSETADRIREYHENMSTANRLEFKRGTPDAPFRSNYHEYVLKRLIREAAENGYDSIGWTTAEIQAERWSDEYYEGYRIEYDQDIPKFLNKYGKKWGATVGTEALDGNGDMVYRDESGERWDTIREWRDTVVSRLSGMDGISDYSKRVTVKEDGDELIVVDKLNGTVYGSLFVTFGSADVWSMPITPAMKRSVLHEGQPMYSFSSITQSFYGDSDMTTSDFKKKDYRQTEGYQKYVENCLNNMRQTRQDFDEVAARQEVEDAVRGIIDVAIAAKAAGYDIFDDPEARGVQDSQKRSLFSSLEPNDEYITSHDISTICDKRKNFSDIHDDIVRLEEERGVPEDKRFFNNISNYFILHKLMADKGLTQPCRQCYVESMRKNLGPMAEAFLNLVHETDPENRANHVLYDKKTGNVKPNNAATREWVLKTFAEHPEYAIRLEDLNDVLLTTEEGLAQLRLQAPLIYEAFNSFYGQAKPKMPKAATPYRFGELTAMLTDRNGKVNERLVRKINHTGGFRLQSYSDFQIQNYTDVLQVLFEASTLGLNGHAYTKVPAFLDATANTNLKRNISIFMYKDGNEWKIDRNDSFPYTLEQIYDIVRADKAGNTGIIAVSQNADMSAWIMANDMVGYGIPFHKSGIAMPVVRNTIVTEKYVQDGVIQERQVKGYSGIIDHTRQQTEVWKDTAYKPDGKIDHKANTKVKKGIDIYDFWDFRNEGNLSKNKLIEKNVKRYIDACEDAGYLPKFRAYVMNNGKVLADVLKYSKEMGYASKDATIGDISFEYKGYRIPYGYYKFLGDFGMFKPDGTASAQEPLSMKNYNFDEAVKFFEDTEELHRNEILQQFSNGEERQRYKDSDLTAEQLTDIVKQKRKEVAEGVVSRKSLSYADEYAAYTGSNDVYGEDFWKKTAQEDIAPVTNQGDIAPATRESAMTETAPVTEETVASDIAPVAEETVTTDIAPVADDTSVLLPDDIEDAITEIERLAKQKEAIGQEMIAMVESAVDMDEAWQTRYTKLGDEWNAIDARIQELEEKLAEADADRLNSLDDADAPPEMEAPYVEESNPVSVDDPFADRDWNGVGNRSVKAYMYEHPEVKPFFQAEAQAMLGELSDTQKGERWYNDQLYYESGGEAGWGGQKRMTSDSIATLLDGWGMSYADIEKGLKAIIEGNGAENIAAAKKIEFMLNDRLLNGYKDFYTGGQIPPNQDYINMLNEQQINADSQEAFDSLMAAEEIAPTATALGSIEVPGQKTFIMPNATYEAIPGDDIAPTATALGSNEVTGQQTIINPNATYETAPGGDIAPTATALSSGEVHGQQTVIKPNATYEAAPGNDIAPIYMSTDRKAVVGQTAMFAPKPQKIARVRAGEAGVRKKTGLWSWAKEHLLDNGMVFEDLSKKTGNRELEAKWNLVRKAEPAAQQLIADGYGNVKSLTSIMEKAESSGKSELFQQYLLHKHNVDRMSLHKLGVDDKAVFGDSVTASMSHYMANNLERANPEFRQWAEEIYAYNRFLRDMLVANGIITKDIANLWDRMYPHYVPVYRIGMDGKIVPDHAKIGVNAPVKKAKGGNQDIQDLFISMAQRTIQTYKAVGKNSFGIELRNTLGSVVENNASVIGDFTENFDMDNLFGVSEEGNRTFTVFENGEKVAFEITDEMYEAMKPKDGILSKKIPVLSHANSIFRGLTTQYSPVFALTNPIRDIQDVLLNSQHPLKTYADIPRAIWQMAFDGYYYREYVKNGGKSADTGNTYFDSESNKFTRDNVAKRVLDKVFALNEVIEMTPRLAEYIASREAGRDVAVSMLDADRVTTNFSAGGDVTKFLNRNGATFLNASVQGAVQQVRNFREAHHKGALGYVGLATRWAIGGLAPVLLNNLLWDDDEEYEDLADYVKQDYYVVGKDDDGKFVRIPKGRALAVLQEAMDIVIDTATGDDEVDLGRFLELGALAIANLAPNNPLENNIFAPILQAWSNKTWYGGDLVPSRLQDLPVTEQYDEKTDSISIWLGELLNISPYKINYVLNQYSGGIGDFIMPMLTPRAESGDDSVFGTLTAPFRDKFTTDSVLNSQTVTDFYDLLDELEVNANARDATEEDIFMYMYLRSIGFETSDLYAQKREIQASDLPDSEKYAQVRELQRQINEIMEEGLSSYNNPNIQGYYAEVGDRRYNYDPEKETWYQIRETNSDGEPNYFYQQEQRITSGFGISSADYWNNREAYDDAYYFATAYGKDIVDTVRIVFGGETFVTYASDMAGINGKDENGESVNGLKKERIIEYCNSLNIPYGEKIILFKSQYPADDTYNEDIIAYLNSRTDISYEEMETVLIELGFEVDEDGYITWD